MFFEGFDCPCDHFFATKLKKALEDNKPRDVAKHASEICRLVCEGLDTEALIVRISSRRPSSSDEELQGLYERTEGETCVLTVWMKTAAKGQVVAFKSFIRTVLHELCHHVDYAYFSLDDSDRDKRSPLKVGLANIQVGINSEASLPALQSG